MIKTVDFSDCFFSFFDFKLFFFFLNEGHPEVHWKKKWGNLRDMYSLSVFLHCPNALYQWMGPGLLQIWAVWKLLKSIYL